MYNELGVTFSYAVELRGKSWDRSGFLLPASNIVPSGQEIVAAVNALWGYVETLATPKATVLTRRRLFLKK